MCVVSEYAVCLLSRSADIGCPVIGPPSRKCTEPPSPHDAGLSLSSHTVAQFARMVSSVSLSKLLWEIGLF